MRIKKENKFGTPLFAEFNATRFLWVFTQQYILAKKAGQLEVFWKKIAGIKKQYEENLTSSRPQPHIAASSNADLGKGSATTFEQGTDVSLVPEGTGKEKGSNGMGSSTTDPTTHGEKTMSSRRSPTDNITGKLTNSLGNNNQRESPIGQPLATFNTKFTEQIMTTSRNEEVASRRSPTYNSTGQETKSPGKKSQRECPIRHPSAIFNKDYRTKYDN
jgi:hypothetical protein